MLVLPLIFIFEPFPEYFTPCSVASGVQIVLSLFGPEAILELPFIYNVPVLAKCIVVAVGFLSASTTGSPEPFATKEFSIVKSLPFLL